MQCAEYRDLVAAHIDGQLARDEQAQATAHVSGCGSCARLLAGQRALRPALQGRNLIHRTPDAVRHALLRAIDADARERAPKGWRSLWWSRPGARLALAGAVVLLLVAGAALFLRARPEGPRAPLFDTIVMRYHAVESGQIEMNVHTDDPTELRAYYVHTGAFTFRNTVVNLEPLGLSLVGGTVTELAGKKSTLSVYRGPRGMVLCHRIQSGGVELPPGGEKLGGDRFYTVDGITICVHFEGDIICFMASAMPRADFVRLLAGHV